MKKLRTVKGMNDILPPESARWHRLERAFRTTMRRHGFGEARPPIVEPTALFVRSIGEATDIVEKEMYTFTDRGEKSLTLRPEGTASCARAYLQHNVQAIEPVTKWFYVGPMYRRERPAKGRYRQFYQAGAELYGDPGPYVDAEMIDMIVSFLRELGVEDVEVMVNSLGSGETRARFREALVAYLEPFADQLSADSQRRLHVNPLRVLDSKAPQDQEIAEGAPNILEYLGDEDREHFDEVRATLTALGTPFVVSPRLVRGLDYYTRTLFEIRGRGGELGAQNALCGGGRYDGMIEELGGKKTPAIGFAMGLERLLLAMPEEEDAGRVDVFVIARSPSLRREVVSVCRDLRASGLSVDADLRGGSLKSQMRRANKNAPLAIIVGEDEVERGVLQIKNLSDSSQHEATRAGAPALIRELLG